MPLSARFWEFVAEMALRHVSEDFRSVLATRYQALLPDHEASEKHGRLIHVGLNGENFDIYGS